MKLSNLFSQKSERISKEPIHSHKKDFLLNENTPFDVTEAFRNLKASLSVSMPKKQGTGSVIMTTSAHPNDGKTTVAVNLALMFAISDVKVVILDADIRKGRIAKYFKQKSEPGLSNYLSGQVPLEKIVHRSRINQNLSYITCGTHSPRPYELMEGEEMKTLIEKLKRHYDYVIIDTPPILLVSDALAFTPYTDGAVLVCRHRSSYISDIASALNTLAFAKANVLGVIVNDYKMQQTKVFGNKKYYYYSSYSYGTTPSYAIPTTPASKLKTKAAAPKAPAPVAPKEVPPTAVAVDAEIPSEEIALADVAKEETEA